MCQSLPRPLYSKVTPKTRLSPDCHKNSANPDAELGIEHWHCQRRANLGGFGDAGSETCLVMRNIVVQSGCSGLLTSEGVQTLVRSAIRRRVWCIGCWSLADVVKAGWSTSEARARRRWTRGRAATSLAVPRGESSGSERERERLVRGSAPRRWVPRHAGTCSKMVLKSTRSKMLRKSHRLRECSPNPRGVSEFGL